MSEIAGARRARAGAGAGTEGDPAARSVAAGSCPPQPAAPVRASHSIPSATMSEDEQYAVRKAGREGYKWTIEKHEVMSADGYSVGIDGV